jgi:hypothetical protein
MGLWSYESSLAQQRLGSICAGPVTTTLADALAQIRRLANPAVELLPLPQSDTVQNLPA